MFTQQYPFKYLKVKWTQSTYIKYKLTSKRMLGGKKDAGGETQYDGLC